MLTINDSRETRAIYRGRGGRIERAQLTRTAAGVSGAKRAAEIIVGAGRKAALQKCGNLNCRERPFVLSRYTSPNGLATLAGLDKSLRAFYKPDTSRSREPR